MLRQLYAATPLLGVLGLIFCPGRAPAAFPMRGPMPVRPMPMMPGAGMNPAGFRMMGPMSAFPMSFGANPYASFGRGNPGMFMTMPSGGSGSYGTSYGRGSGSSSSYGGGSSSSGYGSGSGMSGNPYGADDQLGLYMGYGGGYGANANPYGAKAAAGGYAATQAASQGYQPSASGWIDMATALTAHGVPNEGGRLSWPLAFRCMGPDQSRELRRPLEALLGTAALGRATPQGLQQGGATVDRLRRWLRDRQVGMAEVTYRDADEFLGRIEQALGSMSAY
jgi:hypothetical protein